MATIPFSVGKHVEKFVDQFGRLRSSFGWGTSKYTFFAQFQFVLGILLVGFVSVFTSLQFSVFLITSVATSSDCPIVVRSCTMTASASEFNTITGIVSSAKLNKTWSALTWIPTLSRSWVSNTAVKSFFLRCDTIIDFLAGIQTLSMETTRKFWSVWMV